MIRRFMLFAGIALAFLAAGAQGQNKRKIIIDQDARGPATTDQQSMLALLNSPDVDALGITIVSGDQWRDEEVAHTLRMLELTGHTDVKVYPGAIFPLINSKEEIARWSKLYGAVQYQGAWTKNGESKFRAGPHDPYEVPSLAEGTPTIKAQEEDAAHFIIRTVHKFPHEVTIYAGGPLTNLAQAISLDPKVPELAKELVVMGGSIDPVFAPAEWKTANRREFNFWWDPEAVHIVLRSRWKKITMTTVDISVKTRFTRAMIDTIAKAGTPSAEYIARYADEEYLWDELAALAWLDPGIITKEVQLYMDIDISHTAGYGNTLVWTEQQHPGLGEQLVHVQTELDSEKFNKLLIDLLSRPSPPLRSWGLQPQHKTRLHSRALAPEEVVSPLSINDFLYCSKRATNARLATEQSPPFWPSQRKVAMSENKTDNKTGSKTENNAGKRVIQIMPAVGWRVLKFTQDESGKTESKEVPVIGWGLEESGNVSILVSHPNASDGHAAISISEVPSYVEDKNGNMLVHYQAVAPNQEISEVTKEAEFILGFLRSKQPPKPNK
jgi:purine nucleosidase